eukprot:g27883.t1
MFGPLDTGEGQGKDKGNPIALAEGKTRSEGRSAEDGLDPVDGSGNNGAGESSDEEEGGHFGGSLVETKVVAMGTCMGPSYACIFVGYVEQSLF